jgi:hypothetical protein
MSLSKEERDWQSYFTWLDRQSVYIERRPGPDAPG